MSDSPCPVCLEDVPVQRFSSSSYVVCKRGRHAIHKSCFRDMMRFRPVNKCPLCMSPYEIPFSYWDWSTLLAMTYEYRMKFGLFAMSVYLGWLFIWVLLLNVLHSRFSLAWNLQLLNIMILMSQMSFFSIQSLEFFFAQLQDDQLVPLFVCYIQCFKRLTSAVVVMTSLYAVQTAYAHMHLLPALLHRAAGKQGIPEPAFELPEH